jgi:PAS domain S-box-containing protein
MSKDRLSPQEAHMATADATANAVKAAPQFHSPVLECMTEAVSVCDDKGFIVYTNAAADRMFGYRAGELIGKHVTVQSAYDSAENERIRGTIANELRAAGVWEGEWRNRRKDGGVFYTRAHIALLSQDGQTFWVCVQHDVTRIKAESDALERAEQHLSMLLASIGDHLVSYDRDWKYTYVNDGAAQLLCKSRDELLGRSIWEVFPETIGNQYYSELHRSVAEQRAILSEHYYAAWDLWFENHIYPTPDGVTVFSSDITRRKRTEQALAESEQRFRLIADSAPVLIWVWVNNREGYEFVNREYLRYLGCTLEQVQGGCWRDAIHPDDAVKYFEDYVRAFEKREAFDTQFRFQRHDGQYRWFASRALPRYTPDGAFIGYVGSSIDINDIKKSEAILLDADRRKDEFLATLAHELRNPLAPIRQATQIARSPDATDAQLRWSHDVIERQVAHMAQLLDDLLDVSRITHNAIELRKEPVELASVIDAAVEAARPLIDMRGHRLSVDLENSKLCIEVDALRLSQVIGNLLTNAAKYTDPGGQIHLQARRDKNFLSIRVVDNGIGIAAEFLPTVFEMFSQVKSALDRTEGGLGIGLSLVKGIVELHGGQVAAHSDGLGLGSEFLVRLPFSQPSAQKQTSPANPNELTFVKHKILVTDDNHDAADSLAMLLSLQGHEVKMAYDGTEALQISIDFQPDTVLLDLGMPRLTGFEVAKRMREQPWGQQIRLIAVTGWGQEADKQRALAAGFDDHLTKPIDPRVLNTILQS